MQGDLNREDDPTVIESVDRFLGSVIDREFRVDARIAAGGFGVIYRATHLPTRKAVALKVLHPHLVNDAATVARFHREGATLAMLRDPHTVAGRDVARASDGTLYIAMELLQGTTLHRELKKGRMAWRRAVKIARGIALSLAEAHGLGIVHRDLKPENIALEMRGGVEHVKVLDFGIAKSFEGEHDGREELTAAGTWIGTLDYMAPEQMTANQADGRSDLYALGVMLYEMVAGRRPHHEAKTAAQMMASIYTKTPAPVSTYAELPRALEGLIAQLIRRQPDERVGSARELARLLEAFDGDDDQLTAIHEVRVSKRRLARGSSRDLPSPPPMTLAVALAPTALVQVPTAAMMADTVLPPPPTVHDEPTVITDHALLAETHAIGSSAGAPAPVWRPSFAEAPPRHAVPTSLVAGQMHPAPQPIGLHVGYPLAPVAERPGYQMPDVARDTLARRIAWCALGVIAAAVVAYVKAHI